jgi:Transaldolase/Fructose-6-phosphate aldolase
MSVGTWAGIQAASKLQQDSIDCEITDVYSIAQAAAAVQAKAAVLVLNVTHINVWYDMHPGAIRNPQVPLLHSPSRYAAPHVVGGPQVGRNIYD